MLRRNLDFLATCLYEAGIKEWTVSPGSRNAPIVAGFLRHGGFTLHSFPDERCAAFAALGISQATGQTCGVICTSGTAVLNLYPGVCEAFYQRVPLFVLTADRPEELLDQWDGQTIHQQDVFEPHVLQSAALPQDLDKKSREKEIEKIVFELAELTAFPVKGPVHLNVALRDPIYRDLETPFYDKKPETLFSPESTDPEAIDSGFLHAELAEYPKILIVAGQLPPNDYLAAVIKTLSLEYPVLADITSNLSSSALPGWDMALHSDADASSLKPDLLISFGLSIVSKALKSFLKKHTPEVHWHIQEAGFTGDPFDSEPKTNEISPELFFETMTDITGIDNPEYLNAWKQFCDQNHSIPRDNPTVSAEFATVKQLLMQAKPNTTFHLGNSMTVRYASWVGSTKSKVFCNRGTSGIDGTFSTAVGYALASPDEQVICILGDIGFFYDSNALWTTQIPANLGIVVLNNQGGQIFSWIDGPNALPDLYPWINTPHQRNASHIAADYKLNYHLFNFQSGQDIQKISELNTPYLVEFQH